MVLVIVILAKVHGSQRLCSQPESQQNRSRNSKQEHAGTQGHSPVSDRKCSSSLWL